MLSACPHGAFRYDRVQFGQQRAIALTRITFKLLTIVRQIVKKSLHSLLVQLIPVGTIVHFLQPGRVKYLLELMLHGYAKIRLGEMKRLGYEREPVFAITALELTRSLRNSAADGFL